MPIGQRIGLRVGPRYGLALGPSADPIGAGGLAGVSRDAASGKYVPASSGEWTALMAAAGLATGNPNALHLLQEAAGNAADSIGTFTLTAAGSPLYQQAVPGWTRKKIASSADGNSASLSNVDVGLPDIGAASILCMTYVDMPTGAPAAVRNFIEFGTVATRAALEYTTLSKVRARSGANTLDGTAVPTSAVRPLVLKVNRTGSVCTIYTDQEKVTPTFDAAMAGKKLNLLAVSGGQFAPLAGHLYAATFFNAAAELSDAQVKTLLQTLGWSIPWS